MNSFIMVMYVDDNLLSTHVLNRILCGYDVVKTSRDMQGIATLVRFRNVNPVTVCVNVCELHPRTVPAGRIT